MKFSDKQQKVVIVVLMLGITLVSAALPLWLLWADAASAGVTKDLDFKLHFFFRAFILFGVPTVYWLEAWWFWLSPKMESPKDDQSPAGRMAEIFLPLVLLCVVSNSLMAFFSMADEQYIQSLSKDSGAKVIRICVAIVEPFPKMYFPLGMMSYAFWGAFIYNNHSFIYRLRSNDFSHQVFVAGALRLVLAVLASGLLYYAFFADVYQYDDTGDQVLATIKPDKVLNAGLLVVGAFFAGLYPEQLITSTFNWFYSRVTQAIPWLGKYQYTPMTILQGITLDVELRLKEEGIDSLQALSVCNVEQLQRKVPYSKDTIEDWKDQAKLAAYFSDGEEFATMASLGIRTYSALRTFQKKIEVDDDFAKALNLALAEMLNAVDPKKKKIVIGKFQYFVRFGVFPEG
jgi:hypothetical protein